MSLFEAKSLKSSEEYLNLYRVGDKKYVIGNFQNGVTVYKQQIRALNIFDALVKTRQIRLNDKSFSIVIIGGGIAGLTFAAAAIKAGLSVRLFEKESHLLSLQKGCDRRFLNPNLYEWPLEGSTIPYTKLPFLNWHFDTADNVVIDLMKQFESLKQEKENIEGPLFDTICNFEKFTNIEYKANGRIQVKYKKDNFEEKRYHADLMIYAVGFGRERGLSTIPRTPSYWENDNLHQVGGYKTLVIAGTGDGGLLDAFRALIIDFSYKSILKIAESDQSKYSNLINDLINIKKNSLKLQNKQNKSFLSESFSQLHEKNWEYIFNDLKFHKRTVFLNSLEKTFEESLNHNKVSFINAFIAFILKEKNKIQFLSGDIIKVPHKKTHRIGNVSICDLVNDKGYKYWDRRGPIREKVFTKKIGLSQSELDYIFGDFRKKQELISDMGITIPRWEYHKFINHFYQSEKNKRTYAFLTQDTTSIWREYLSKIKLALTNVYQLNSTFRLSMHRVIQIGKELHYQQITPYEGTKVNKNANSTLEQIFPIDRGNVGLSIASGLPTLITRTNEDDFRKLAEKLKLGPEYEEGKIKSKSFFTIPILAKVDNNKFATCVVLYIDADSVNFFTNRKNKNLIGTIYAALDEIVSDIERRIDVKEITMESHSIKFLHVNSNCFNYLRRNSCWNDINIAKEMPILRKFYSFSLFCGNHIY